MRYRQTLWPIGGISGWVANCLWFGMVAVPSLTSDYSGHFEVQKAGAATPAVQSPEPLPAFLKAVLELSFTLLGKARLTGGRAQPALEAVREVLSIICSLEGRIEDPKSRTAIHNRAIDLAFALDAFSMLAG